MTIETTGSPSHVEPVLAVKDITETVTYWHEVLGFPDKWTWGEPPNHGGVSWHGASVQFSADPELASLSKGNTIFIRAKNLEGLYNFHQKKNASIVEPLENKPWGMAGYTVQDLNGYYIIFAGAPISTRKERSGDPVSSIKIVHRKPTIKEYQYLTSSVGWSLFSDDITVEKLLAAPIFAVIAQDSITNNIIGCALVLGDHASFYYIKDVIVHPEWQAKHIGTALMKEIQTWLSSNAANNALVSLITPETLAPFYKQFDFAPAFCMVHTIQHKGK